MLPTTTTSSITCSICKKPRVSPLSPRADKERNKENNVVICVFVRQLALPPTFFSRSTHRLACHDQSRNRWAVVEQAGCHRRWGSEPARREPGSPLHHLCLLGRLLCRTEALDETFPHQGVWSRRCLDCGGAGMEALCAVTARRMDCSMGLMMMMMI